MITMPTVKTSCRYYNVKLSSVFLKYLKKKKQTQRIKLPFLTYSDHKVTFTNPKLTNIQYGDLELT